MASSSSTRPSATGTSSGSGTTRARTSSTPEPERARNREAQASAGRDAHQQLRVALDLPPRVCGHAAQPRAPGERERLAPPAPLEDAPARDPLPAYLVRGWPHL